MPVPAAIVGSNCKIFALLYLSPLALKSRGLLCCCPQVLPRPDLWVIGPREAGLNDILPKQER